MTLADASSLLGVPMHVLISDEETFEESHVFGDLFDNYEEELYNNHVEVSKRKTKD
jgi:hypothetical protein